MATRLPLILPDPIPSKQLGRKDYQRNTFCNVLTKRVGKLKTVRNIICLATSQRATRNSKLKELLESHGLKMKVFKCGMIIINRCKNKKIFYLVFLTFLFD